MFISECCRSRSLRHPASRFCALRTSLMPLPYEPLTINVMGRSSGQIKARALPFKLAAGVIGPRGVAAQPDQANTSLYRI